MKKRFLICCVCLVCLLTMSAFAASPVIVAQPQNYYFPAGTESGTAYFTVLASGDDLSYQWQSSTNGTMWINTSASGSTTNSITAHVGSSMINGVIQFRCIVSNTEGSVTSQVVTTSAGAFVLNSLPQFLSFVSETADAIFGWASDCCTTIVSEPLLLFTCGFIALGGAIGIVSRLLSRS